MQRAAKLHLKGDRKDAYVYGTLNKIEKQHNAKAHKPKGKK